MFDLLRSLGFERVSHYASGQKSVITPFPLNLATYNILQMHMDEPVLILEDDLEFMPACSFILDIPNGADAVYVGICGSNYNFEKNQNEGRSRVEIVDSIYAKVLNMLGAHAILYLSRAYKECIAQALKTTLRSNDVEIAKHQALYNVYALRYPICWQSAKFNKEFTWVEYITKRYIDEYGYTHSL